MKSDFVGRLDGFNFICEADFIRVYSDFIAPRAISLKYPMIYDIISSINENLTGVISMKSFVCSLCHNGILGGGLYLDSQSLTYKTSKLTVDQKYRNLVLPLQEIKEISWKWIIFPVATVDMKNGERYKFIIFNKSRFEKWFQEYSH